MLLKHLIRHHEYLYRCNAHALCIRVHFCATGKRMVSTKSAFIFKWQSLIPVQPLCALSVVLKAAESLPLQLESVTL